MPVVTADLLRQLSPKFRDLSDTEISRIVHQAVAPDQDYRKFETMFLGEPSPMKELGRGIVRGARTIKGGWDMLAGGLAGAAGDSASRDEAFKSYEDNLNAANRIAPRRRVRDIRSVGDAAAWGAGLVGETAPVLMSGGIGGAGAVGAIGGFAAVPGSAARIEQLMPEASSNRKALAAAGMVVINGAGDAFIPIRLLSRIARPGVGGIRRDIAMGAAVGAATPVAERTIATAATGKPGTFLRTGYPDEQD
jgi:hypothetical protein